MAGNNDFDPAGLFDLRPSPLELLRVLHGRTMLTRSCAATQEAANSLRLWIFVEATWWIHGRAYSTSHHQEVADALVSHQNHIFLAEVIGLVNHRNTEVKRALRRDVPAGPPDFKDLAPT
eukprot:symbB.v1.2.039282.t1/scaffold6460.1/size17923/1